MEKLTNKLNNMKKEYKKYKDPMYVKSYQHNYYINNTLPKRQKEIQERIANGGPNYRCRKIKLTEEEKKENILKAQKKYRLKNKEKIKKYFFEYQKQRNYLFQLCYEYLKKHNNNIFLQLKDISEKKYN